VYSATVHVTMFPWLDVVDLHLYRHRVLMTDCRLRNGHHLPRSLRCLRVDRSAPTGGARAATVVV
jgi:hypothetical protein